MRERERHGTMSLCKTPVISGTSTVSGQIRGQAYNQVLEMCHDLYGTRG